jgi:4a-hydroxytetrahydrobiopterin dehydratase
MGCPLYARAGDLFPQHGQITPCPGWTEPATDGHVWQEPHWTGKPRELSLARSKRMNTELAQKRCAPCAKGTAPLKGFALARMLEQLGNGWTIVDEHHLEKEFRFKNFREALDFTNRVGEVAEQEGHHPDIFLGWGRVKLEIWTHSIGGLSESDFILAAKVDAVE